jgi:hypothetical protein
MGSRSDISRGVPLGGAGCAKRARRWAEGCRGDAGWTSQTSVGCVAMGEIVLRVRLTGGGQMDVTYEESGTVDADEVIEHIVSTLAQDSGVLRARHGDRLVVLYGRGVAAVEMAPRGAVL